MGREVVVVITDGRHLMRTWWELSVAESVVVAILPHIVWNRKVSEEHQRTFSRSIVRHENLFPRRCSETASYSQAVLG